MPQREPGAKRLVWWSVGTAAVFTVLAGGLFLLPSWLWYAKMAYIVRLDLPAGYTGPVRVAIPVGAPANRSAKRLTISVAANGAAPWPDAAIGDRFVEWHAWDANVGRLPQYVLMDPANNPKQRALWVLSTPTTAGSSGEFFIGTEAEFLAYPGNTLLGPRPGVPIGPN